MPQKRIPKHSFLGNRRHQEPGLSCTRHRCWWRCFVWAQALKPILNLPGIKGQSWENFILQHAVNEAGNTNPFCSAHVLCKTTAGRFASSAASSSLNSVLQEQPVGSATSRICGRCSFYYPQTSYLTVKSQTEFSDSKTIGVKRVSNAAFILLHLAAGTKSHTHSWAVMKIPTFRNHHGALPQLPAKTCSS